MSYTQQDVINQIDEIVQNCKTGNLNIVTCAYSYFIERIQDLTHDLDSKSNNNIVYCCIDFTATDRSFSSDIPVQDFVGNLHWVVTSNQIQDLLTTARNMADETAGNFNYNGNNTAILQFGYIQSFGEQTIGINSEYLVVNQSFNIKLLQSNFEAYESNAVQINGETLPVLSYNEAFTFANDSAPVANINNRGWVAGYRNVATSMAISITFYIPKNGTVATLIQKLRNTPLNSNNTMNDNIVVRVSRPGGFNEYSMIVDGFSTSVENGKISIAKLDLKFASV